MSTRIRLYDHGKDCPYFRSVGRTYRLPCDCHMRDEMERIGQQPRPVLVSTSAPTFDYGAPDLPVTVGRDEDEEGER